MKSFIRSLTPRWILSLYHRALASLAAFWYGFPSRRMVIVGVTGTKGKTTAATLIWSVLQAGLRHAEAGSGSAKAGLVGTAEVRIGDRAELNPYHMTMPGRFTLQKILRRMADAGCTHAVVETTSLGLEQWRHAGIWYDIAVLTNLAPQGTTEHFEAHGGFEAYRDAKGRLFAALMRHPRKKIGGREVPRVSIVGNDSPHKDFFLNFPADRKITFGVHPGADYAAEDIRAGADGVSFRVKGEAYSLPLIGEFNVENALPAVAAGEILGIQTKDIARGLASVRTVPGRMERVAAGQDFDVFVDYAHEKASMEAALQTARGIARGKLMVLLGAEGGGRDKAKRPAMGELAGRLADYVVVSNVDPYDDDPKEIIEDIARAVEAQGKVRDKNLFAIEDRREGIRRALSLAARGDVVLITGKGAEQSMILGKKRIPWDDREVVREELGRLLVRA